MTIGKQQPQTVPLNIPALLRELREDHPVAGAWSAGIGERYNGGWTKSVTGLDRSRADGYSIQGEFLPRKEGVNIVQVGGLYLDCGIGGSRKNQERVFALLRILGEDQIEVLATSSGPDWAVHLWPAIERALVEGIDEALHNPLEGLTPEALEVLRDLLMGAENQLEDTIEAVAEDQGWDLDQAGEARWGAQRALEWLQGLIPGAPSPWSEMIDALQRN